LVTLVSGLITPPHLVRMLIDHFDNSQFFLHFLNVRVFCYKIAGRKSLLA
jgi:hypothetical protein